MCIICKPLSRDKARAACVCQRNSARKALSAPRGLNAKLAWPGAGRAATSLDAAAYGY